MNAIISEGAKCPDKNVGALVRDSNDIYCLSSATSGTRVAMPQSIPDLPLPIGGVIHGALDPDYYASGEA